MYGEFLHGNAGLSTEVSEMMVTGSGEPAVQFPHQLINSGERDVSLSPVGRCIPLVSAFIAINASRRTVRRTPIQRILLFFEVSVRHSVVLHFTTTTRPYNSNQTCPPATSSLYCCHRPSSPSLIVTILFE